MRFQCMEQCDDLLGGLAGGVHDLRVTRAHPSVRIEAGEAQIGVATERAGGQ